jgi:hypothetical protein
MYKESSNTFHETRMQLQGVLLFAALLAATALPFSATDKVHIVFYGEAG